MRIVPGLLFLFCTTLRLHGQDSSQVYSIVPSHAIKFSPFHLGSFYPTIQLAYEFRIMKTMTIQLDGGYVVNYKTDELKFKDKSGFKVKIEPRYYFTTQRDTHGFYGALEFYHNRVSFDHNNTQTECFDGSCLDKYRRTYFYRSRYEEYGVVAKVGMLVYVFDNFIVDYNLGIGGRFIDYTFPEYIRIDRDRASDWYDIPRTTDRTTLAPFINFRVGYRLK